MPLSPGLPPLFGLPRTREKRSLLSLPPLALQSRMGLLPAWQGQVETSLDWRCFPQRWTGKSSSCSRRHFPRLRAWPSYGPSAAQEGTYASERWRPAAKALGLRLQSLGVTGSDDFERVFEEAKKGSAQALTSVPSPFLATHRALIFDFAAKNRLPAMYSTSDFVEAGGLMSYGPASLITGGARQPSLIRSSRAPSPPISRWSNQRSSSSSST